MIKHFTRYLVSALIMVWFIWSFCNAVPQGVLSLDDTFPYQGSPADSASCNDTSLWDCVHVESNWIMKSLLETFWLDSWAFEWEHKFLTYSKAILNLSLSVLSTVAVLMTIYTFYLMFFTENEAWIKKAKWNLVWIFIALAVIWLAWVIVSFIFWWYEKNWAAAAG